MNTGRVGGPDGDERSRKVRIKHSSAIVKGIAEGTIEWERDPDFGYLVAASVPGIDEPDDPAAAPALRGAGPRRRVPRARRALQGRARRVPAAASRASRTRSSPPSRRGVRPAAANASADAGSGRAVPREPGALRTDAPRVPLRRRGVLRLAAAAAGRGSRTSTCARCRSTRPSSGARGRASSRRRRSAASSRRCARSCATRSAPSACPDASFAPRRPRRLPDAPRPHEVDAELEALDGDGPLALRNRALVELVYSAGLRSQEAIDLDLADVDFEQELVHVRGKGGKERVVPLGEEASHSVARLPARVAPAARARRRERALPLGARPPARHEHAAPPASPPAPPAACVRHAPARGRRRPAHDPGAARPQLALDDADVQPRGRSPPAQGLRPLAPALLTSAPFTCDWRAGRRLRRRRSERF